MNSLVYYSIASLTFIITFLALYRSQTALKLARQEACGFKSVPNIHAWIGFVGILETNGCPVIGIMYTTEHTVQKYT